MPRETYGHAYADRGTRNSITATCSKTPSKTFCKRHVRRFSPPTTPRVRGVRACPYLYLCKTGCPFVKRLYKSGASYTCKLQAIYHDHPHLYPPSRNPRSDAYRYAAAMRPAQTASLLTIERPALTDRMPSLREIVAQDPALEGVFDDEAFRLVADGASFAMKSQVLRPERTIIALWKNSDLALHIRKDIMEAACRWPVNNALYLMLLSGNTVT